jgi:DNA-binding response OmpR family regulator
MASPLNIMIVEDNDLLRKELIGLFQDYGHHCAEAFCAEDVELLPNLKAIDIFIIDINLPGEDGVSFAERLRKVHQSAGVIMMSGRTGIADRVVGYRAGADIYLPKPVDPDELLSAVEALGRRLKMSAQSERSRLDRARFHLTGPMATINLTVHETDLLVAFLIAQERTLERWLVAEKFGLSGDDINTASMEVRLSKLRKKMQLAGLDAPIIRSLRNTGYMLCHEIELV